MQPEGVEDNQPVFKGPEFRGSNTSNRRSMNKGVICGLYCCNIQIVTVVPAI